MDFDKIYPPEKYVTYLDNTAYATSVVQMYRYITPYLIYRLDFEKWYLDAVNEMVTIAKANNLVNLVKYISDSTNVLCSIQDLVKYGHYKLGNSCGIHKVIDKMKEISPLYTGIIDDNKHVLPKQQCALSEVYNGLKLEDGKLINIETTNFEDKPYGIPAHLRYLEIDKLDGVNPDIAGVLEAINITAMVIDFISRCDTLTRVDTYKLYLMENNVTDRLSDIPINVIYDMLDVVEGIVNKLNVTKYTIDDLYYLLYNVKDIRRKYDIEKKRVNDYIEKLIDRQHDLYIDVEAKLRF